MTTVCQNKVNHALVMHSEVIRPQSALRQRPRSAMKNNDIN